MDAAQKVIKHIALLLSLALLVAVPGRSQSLSASPNPVALTGTITFVNVVISGSGAFTLTHSGTFFSVSSDSNTAPANLTVGLQSTLCSNGGVTCNGSITLTPTSGTALTIPVSFTPGSGGGGGGGGGPITASPASVTFNTTANQVVSSQVSLSTSNTSLIGMTLTPSVSWLSQSFLSSSQISSGSNVTLTVVANTTGLTNGQTGTLTITPNNGGAATTISVTVNLNGSGSYTLGQSSVALTYPNGTTSAFVTVFSNNASVTTYNALISCTGTNFLLVNGGTQVFSTSVGNGLSLTLNNPGSLATGGYSCQVTVSNPSNSSDQVVLPVTLSVNGGGTTGGSYTVSTSNVAFQCSYSGTQCTGTNTQAAVTVSSGTQTTYTATATSNGNWLSIGQVGGFTGTTISGQTSSPLYLFFNPSFAPTVSNTYTGSVTISNPSNTNDFVTINVTLQVSNGTGGGVNGYSVSASSLSFSTSPGSSPASQFLTVTVPSGAGFTTSITANSGTNFINSPCNGCSYAGTQSLTISLNASGLSSGTYTNTITFTGGGSNFGFVTVTLTVGTGSGSGGGTGSSVAPTTLNFAYQTAQANTPPQQYITNSVTGAFTASASSAQNWLIISPTSGTGPSTLIASVIPQALSAGIYQGTITVNTPIGTQTVTVNLTVSTGIVLYANPGTITLSTSNATSPSTVFSITASDNSAQTVTTTSQASWITVNSATNGGTTPTSLLVSANPAGLCNGLNVGTITATANNATNSPLSIPVVFQVSGQSTTTCTSTGSGPLTVSPSSLTLSAASNSGTSTTQNLQVTTPASNTVFSISTNIVSGNINWLSVASPCNNCAWTGSTNLVISANPSQLAAGTYQGNVVLTTNGTTQTVPVTFSVGASGASGNITVSPTSLSFSAPLNGSAPASQSVTLSGTTGVGFIYQVSTTSGGSWLSATYGGTLLTNGQSLLVNGSQLTVNVTQSGLAAGTYSGTITLSPNGGSAVTISVTMTVQANTVSATPSSLTFTYQAGSSAPSSQTIQVTGGSASLPFSATASSSGCGSGNWLSVSPTTGTTTASGTTNLTVSINTSGLAAGSCSGTITVSGTGTATGTSTTTVSLAVTAPLPTIQQVSSAASYVGTSISPGEIITIFGTSLGPTPLVSLALDSSGKVATILGGVQVLIGGIPAPMIYASNTQVAAVVPYEVALLKTTTVLVKFLGQTSNGIGINVSSAAPGIFTANASGTGPGAILNANGSVNTPSNPATKGSVVAIYMTGEGQTSPAGITGSVTTATLPAPQVTPAPLLPVAVLIDGSPATVAYAGEAPSLVAGVMQLNVVIPAGAKTGDLSLVVSIGGTSSQNGVTVSVR